MSKQSKIIFGILIIATLLAGVLMLFFGVRGLIQKQLTIRGYEKTQGVLCDYTLASEGGYDAARKTQTSDTYYLIYRYTVNGQEYTIKTDYSTSILPQIGAEREIRYSHQDPQDAFIMGTDQNAGLLFIGFMFTVVPLFFILVFTGLLQRIPPKAFQVGIGAVFFILGYGSLSMISNSLSPVGIFHFFEVSFSFPLLIPLLLLAVGLWIIIKSLISPKGETKKGSSSNIQTKKD